MAERRLPALAPLRPAEERLLAELGSGDFVRLGDGTLPDHGDGERAVRASLVRLLALGGLAGHRPHEKGVRITGAWITGVLDLEGCRLQHDLGLTRCRFDEAPVLRSAIIENLVLDGSALPGLDADRIEARGGIYLRAARIQGEARLRGARLGGNLEGDGATIEALGLYALTADGLEAQGGVLVRGAKVRGGIGLEGARLGADLDLGGTVIERPDGIALNADGLATRGDVVLGTATLGGETRLVGARIGGDLDTTSATFERPGGAALVLARAVIEGAFFLRGRAAVRGTLNLTAATIGALDDEPASWPAAGDLRLNRCRYGAFIGGPVDAATRLDWLARQDAARWGEDFWPQPYEQLAKVLQEMGHGEDARAVLIEKDRLQRKARRTREKRHLARAALWAWDGLLGITVRYGRQPLLAFVWLALFWAIGVAMFAAVEAHQAFKPNIPLFLRSPEWTLCAAPTTERRFMAATQTPVAGLAAPGQSQLACFRAQTEAASYPKLNFWMYSLDTLLPVLEIGQNESWTPDPTTAWGYAGKTYLYAHITLGWVFSLLAVAGFSGLVKAD